MKSADEVVEFRGKDREALQAIVSDSKEELMRLRFRRASGQLEDTARLMTLRKKIARAKTILVEKSKEGSE